jgi:hypothetical protein
LWGNFDKLVIGVELIDVRPDFGKSRIWLRETDRGVKWLARHLEVNLNGYVKLTASALKRTGDVCLPPVIVSLLHFFTK